jgi:predicted TIM-barrel enzyme
VIRVVCHGGPIAGPEDASYVLKRTEGVVGFFGASSMERLPTERTGRLRYRRQRDSPANPEHPRQDSNLRPTA